MIDPSPGEIGGAVKTALEGHTAVEKIWLVAIRLSGAFPLWSVG
jgi:hypothetical protein